MNATGRRARQVIAAANADPGAAAQSDDAQWRLLNEKIIALVASMDQRLAETRRRADQAQAREAISRAALTLALTESLAARYDAAARRRNLSLQLHRLAARPRPGGRRLAWLDRLLAALRWPAQALLIAGSGLWRPSGITLRHRLWDLREMARYARRGPDPQARPRALVEQAWYLTLPGAARSRHSPLVHYLVSGLDQGYSPHPLFDPHFYRTRNADALGASGLDPLTHFLRSGAFEGRDPHPLFSLDWYLGARPDVAASGANPLLHYLEFGWRDGASPHPLFDAEWYGRQLSAAEAEGPALVHYLTQGWRKGLSPHPLFDPGWYLETYADVAEGGDEPLSHFAAAGGQEGRSPGPWFDTAHYVAARGEALAPGFNPLTDYLTGGAWRVGEARPGFATAAYLAARPELAAQGLTPLEHWARIAGPPARV